jgi:hypothetical protein
MEVLMKKYNIIRAFLWVACEKVTRGNAKQMGKHFINQNGLVALGSSTSQSLRPHFE